MLQLDEGDPVDDFLSRTNRMPIQDLRKLIKGFFDSTLGMQVCSSAYIFWHFSSNFDQASSKRAEEMQKQQELLLAEARRELDQEKQSRSLYERESDARLTKAQRESVS